MSLKIDNRVLIFIIVVIGLASLAWFVSKFLLKPKSLEGFGMLPSFALKVSQEVKGPDNMFYSVPGQYQAMMSPRLSNVDYGANIRYNMPSLNYQAVDAKNPLSMANTVFKQNKRENYDTSSSCGSCSGSGCGSVTCGKGGCSSASRSHQYNLPAGYSAGNFNETLYSSDSNNNKKEQYTVQSALPVGTMNTINSVGQDGDLEQPIIYDRYIYANRNSNLRSQGDFIRGDLPIVPCEPEWFRPSVQPNIDLNQGALNVLGGYDAEQQQKLSALMNITSGGTQTTIAGQNLATQFSSSLGTGLNDLQISTYP